MFVVTLRYMDMVLTLLEFIRATRDGIWPLHLSSMEGLCKHFFANNRLKYAQMVPLYLAEMHSLKESDPDIWSEFSQGHFCVKKSQVPFCSIGVDHALEHVNRAMKVKGGLSGITQKPAALLRFFLIAPELTRLSEEVMQMAGISSSQRTKHHELSQAITERHECNIQKMKSVMVECNPFQQEDACLKNFVTKAVMPEPVKRDILKSITVGQECYNTFVKERVVGAKNLWDKMSKVKLLTWTDASKTVKIGLPTKEIELKQTRSLFARLLIIARTREGLDVQDLIGRYEFSCVPRSLFAPDGSLLPCTDKSKLMALLESLGTDETERSDEDMEQDLPSGDSQIENRDDPNPMTLQTEGTDDPQPTTLETNEKAIILDGMAVVNELSCQKIKTCLEIAQAFVRAIDSKSQNYTLVHVVFDRYDIDKSLKTRTRNRRQGKEGACCKYDVSD